MSFERLNYGRNWTNVEDFPSYVEGEDQVRANYQYHPEAIRTFVNSFLEALEAESGSRDIGTLDGKLQDVLSTLRTDLETLASGGVPDVSRCVPVRFEEEDWTVPAEEGGYFTLSIDRSVHKRPGDAFGYNIWHNVEGHMVSNTWGVAGTQVSLAEQDGSVILRSRTPYAGVITFFG